MKTIDVKTFKNCSQCQFNLHGMLLHAYGHKFYDLLYTQ